jgi:hypothetical protein
MARSDEMTPEDAREHGYRKISVPMINEQPNTNEDQYDTLFYLLQ